MKYLTIILCFFYCSSFAQTYDYIIGDLTGKKVRVTPAQVSAGLDIDLADVSSESGDATESTYTMTATVPVNFKSSDNNSILYLDETNERIGIGTASSSVKLNVFGTTGANTPQVVVGNRNTFTQQYSGHAASNPAIIELSATIPSFVCSISSASTNTTAGAMVWLNRNGKTEGVNELRIGQIETRTDGDTDNGSFTIQLANNGTLAEKVRVRYNGDVGINTTAPQSLLDVQGNAGSAGVLTLASKELTVVDADRLGQINFNAPLESDGSDAILNGASIWAEADATFTTTVNTTDLVFATGTSEAAVEKVRITSAGKIGGGIAVPISKLHIYENNALTDATVGLTIEQDGTGDAVEQFLLTGGQRYVQGIDNTDDHFKLSYSADVGTDNIYDASNGAFIINQHTTINGNVIVDSPDGLQFDIDGNITTMDDDETKINADSVKMSSLVAANESEETPASIVGATVTGKLVRYSIEAIDSALLLVKSIAIMSFVDSAFTVDVTSNNVITNLANDLYSSYSLTKGTCITMQGDSAIINCDGVYEITHNSTLQCDGGGVFNQELVLDDDADGIFEEVPGIGVQCTSVNASGIMATPTLHALLELSAGDVIKPAISKYSGTGDEEFRNGQFVVEKL